MRTGTRHVNKECFATIEHLLPRSKGGRNNLDNLLLACRGCNHSRGDRDAFEFYLKQVEAGRSPRRDVLMKYLRRCGLVPEALARKGAVLPKALLADG
jgi:hypothetical protein